MERTLWVDCTPWMRQENERRKGRKGRKPPATIRGARFINDISHLDVRCGSRFGPLGMAETGGNSLQKLCSRNGPQFCCFSQGVHPRSRLA
jgi:hypothetical protein